MNCRYVQSRLSAYVDMELSGHDQQQIRAHLEQCLECSCEYERLRKVKLLLRQLPSVSPTRDAQAVWLYIRQNTQVSPKRALIQFSWQGVSWWRIAGSVAAIGALFWWSQLPETNPIESPNPIRSSVSFNPSFRPVSAPVLMPQSLSMPYHSFTVPQPAFSPTVQATPLTVSEHPVFVSVSNGSGAQQAFEIQVLPAPYAGWGLER